MVKAPLSYTPKVELLSVQPDKVTFRLTFPAHDLGDGKKRAIFLREQLEKIESLIKDSMKYEQLLRDYWEHQLKREHEL